MAPLPALLPLLAWRQDHPAHVFAVVDRTGADLQLYPSGATQGARTDGLPPLRRPLRPDHTRRVIPAAS
jgi:hypothetical protein